MSAVRCPICDRPFELALRSRWDHELGYVYWEALWVKLCWCAGVPRFYERKWKQTFSREGYSGMAYNPDDGTLSEGQ